jgi:magnesium transporter
MDKTVLASDVQTLLDNRQFAKLRQALQSWHPNDLAELIDALSEQDRAIVFRILPREVASDVFEYLEFETQSSLLRALGHEEVANILNDMAPDDRTALLEELPGPAAKQLIELLTADERKVAQSLLGYPKESVGRLMTPDYVAVKSAWTVQEVLDHIRTHGKDKESLNVIYVIDEQGRLVEDIRIRDILLADPRSRVRDIADGQYTCLLVTDEKEKAVELFKKYDRVALPVVNGDRFLIGIVTIDDVMDIVEDQYTEDLQKFGGLEALDYPYTSTPLWEMVKRRAGWLTVLFLGEMLTATAMAFFENELAKAVVLALFVPLIISSGGNSGSQAATLIIRAMVTGELEPKDWKMVFWRESLSGLILGSILGVIGFLRILIWTRFTDIYGPHWFLVGATVALSLLGVVLWGTLTGSMLPFILKRFKFDPAASSAPFVATLVDVAGLVIYFSIAILVLRGTLL